MRGPILCLFAAGFLGCTGTRGPRIDKIFESFSSKSPGCSVGVSQNGKTVFQKSYGMADLEHDIPLTPESTFYMASVSKQFTAMSVLLLAEDGKIQLNDSIRKTIPELPDYANRITLYHLLTHTSGVRDYLKLGALAGLPADSVYTDRSALHMIARQSALNFEPGSEFLYSNSGYVLLSLVVKRVAGENLDAFAREKIFGPLGMNATRFQHDHSSLVPGKAFGYQRRDGVWHTSNSMLDVVGDGGLYSSAADMLRWLANFDDPKVGAKALKIMRTAGKLRSGREIPYGMGLAPGNIRGLATVEHGGALAGYRTDVLLFPAQRLSVVCLCNNGSVNPSDLAGKMAELYLAADMKSPAAAAKRNVSGTSLSAEAVHAKAGLYRREEGGYIEIVERDGKLFRRGAPNDLIALDNRRFTDKDAPEGWELEFDGSNPAKSLELSQPGDPPAHFERATPVALSESEMKAYIGDFESAELDARYRILADAQGLSVEAGDEPGRKIESTGADRMRAGGLELVFHRDSTGRVDGFYLNFGRGRNVRFRRI
jgi:CubicO group peptidase (beta-lactamase class C family)